MGKAGEIGIGPDPSLGKRLIESTFCRALALFLAYLALAEIGYLIGFFRPEPAATFWPPIGLTVAVLLRGDRRKWPAYLCSIFFAQVVISLFHHQSLPIALIWGVAGSLEPFLAVLCITFFSGRSFDLLRLKDVGALVFSAVVSPIPAAILAATASVHWLGVPSYWDSVRDWWFAVSLGEVVVTPFFLVWSGGVRIFKFRNRAKEAAILLLLIALMAHAVFGGKDSLFGIGFIPPYMIFPLLFWGLFRFEEYGSTATVLILSSIAAYHTTSGSGPFALLSSSALDRLIVLQSYLSFAALSSLALTAALAEGRQHLDALRSANENLKRSEELFRATFDRSEIGKVLIVPPDGRFTRVNARFCEMSGYSEEELLRMTFAEITHPDDKSEGREALNKLLSRELSSYSADKRYIRKDGSPIWVSISAAPIFDADGRVVSFVTAILDISDRKMSEESRQKTLLKYQELVDSIDGIVWEITPEFKFTFVSKQAERILGYPVEQWKNEPDFWASHIHPDDRGESIAFCKEQCLRLQDHDFEYRMIAADGRVIWMRDLVHVIAENRRLIGLRGIMVDITGAKQAETKLLESEEEIRRVNETLEGSVRKRTAELSQANAFLSSLIENIPSMIFVKDAKDLSFIRFNRAGEELVGFRREDLIGKSDYDFFTKSEADFFTSQDRTVLAKGSVLDIPEEPIHTRTQGERVLHTKKIPLYDLEGRPEYLVGISEDITEKKRAEADRIKLIQERQARIEAEKGIQLRDDFLSIASHELRTPLTPIRMYLQLVKRHIDTFAPELPKVAALQKAINSAEMEFERFLNLVENLLDVSRINAGRLVLDLRECDLTEIVRNVANRFEIELSKVKCDLSLDLRDQMIGRWDKNRIEQVVVNLLGNAMKYGAGKPIEITVCREGEKALLRIRDHGIGIAKENQEKLFNKFERVAPIREFGGFGLGLFIVKQIIQAHGGAIRVESELGQGAVFIVELPFEQRGLQALAS